MENQNTNQEQTNPSTIAYCKNCGAMLSPDLQECPMCGAAVTHTQPTPKEEKADKQISSDTVRCKYCGGPIDANTEKCPWCDKYLSEEQPQLIPPEKDNNKKIEILAAIGVSVFFAALFIMAIVNSHFEPAKQLNSEIEAIEEVSYSDDEKLADLQKRYDELPDSIKKYVTSYDKLQNMKLIQEALVVKADVLDFKKRYDRSFSLDVDELDELGHTAEQVKEEYQALSDEQKSYVDGNARDTMIYMDIFISDINTKKENLLHPTPPPTPEPPPKTTYMTLEKFNQIETGMSYRKVADIVGKDGTLVYESEFLGVITKIYSWYGSDGFSNANITVQDGVVTSKSQFGLQ